MPNVTFNFRTQNAASVRRELQRTLDATREGQRAVQGQSQQAAQRSASAEQAATRAVLAENAKRTTLLSLARFFNVSLDYLADDEVEERGTRIYASAGHFDVTKLTPEGRERYEEYIEFLADKFTK